MKAVLTLTALALAAGVVTPAIAGPVSIQTPWVRETPPASKNGAGYGVLVNNGRTEDRLLGGSTPAADRVEVHSVTMAE